MNYKLKETWGLSNPILLISQMSKVGQCVLGKGLISRHADWKSKS